MTFGKTGKRIIIENKRRAVFSLLMLAIPIAHFLVFYLYINLNSFALAFKKYEIISGVGMVTKFAKLDNFKNALGQLFSANGWLMIKNSLIFEAINLFFVTPLTLIFSFYIYKKCFMSKFFKVMLFMPYILSEIIVATLYRCMTNNVIPEIMSNWFHVADATKYQLLTEESMKRGAAIVFNIIMWFGINSLIRASSDENNYVKKFKLSFNALDEPNTGKYENVRFVHQKFLRLKQELAADTVLFPEGAKEKVKSALLQIPNACTTNYKETLDRHVAGDDYGVDSWCGVYDWYDSEANRYRLEQATEQGDGSWWYGCIQPTNPYPAYHIDDNLLSARALNWMMMDYGIQGNHYWAVNIWSVYGGSYTYRDVWTDALAFPGAVGDGYIIYPGSRYGLDTAIASIRLEAIRDGLEDYEYLYKLKNLSEDLADKYDVFDYDFNENMSKLYDLIYQGTIIHNDIDAFAVARETVAELISLAQKGVLVTFDRSSLNGKITANVYGGDNVSEVKVNNVSATAAKSGEGNLFTASFFPAGYANVSLKCGNENITKKIFVGGLSVLVNSFESESVIGGIVCSDESEYDDIADTSVSLSQEFAKNNSALKISCVKGTSKSYKNSVTLSAENGVISDSERFAFIDFEVYNPQDKAIEVFVTLKSKNKAVTLVSAVARPGQWSKISLQFVNLGDFDLSDLQSVTFAFSPLNTLENFDIYLDNVKMTARGEL